MPDGAEYREVRYEVPTGVYVLTVYDGRDTHRVRIETQWNASITVRLMPDETCDIEETKSTTTNRE